MRFAPLKHQKLVKDEYGSVPILELFPLPPQRNFIKLHNSATLIIYYRMCEEHTKLYSCVLTDVRLAISAPALRRIAAIPQCPDSEARISRVSSLYQ